MSGRDGNEAHRRYFRDSPHQHHEYARGVCYAGRNRRKPWIRGRAVSWPRDGRFVPGATVPSLPKTILTEEQYLELDRAAERKSEYYDGEIFAIAGAGMAHNQIAVNTTASLHTQLRGKQCQALSSDMRTRIGLTARYAYPDVTVVCGRPEVLDSRKDILTNPTVIIEVLSPATAEFDRGFKFVAYTAIPSLQQYVLIASDRPFIEVFTRRPTVCLDRA